MLKRKFLITATLLFISPVFIQVNSPTPVYAQRAQDIQGWNNTRWGMSYEDVKVLYPSIDIIQSTEANGYGSKYSHYATLNSFLLGNSYYQANFFFTSNRLESIVFHWDEIGSSPLTDLISSLSGRYGQPIHSTQATTQWIWHMPTTKITITIPEKICPSIYECGMSLNYMQQPILEGL